MMPEMLSGVFWNHTLSRVFLRQAQLAANHVRGCSKLSEVCDLSHCVLDAVPGVIIGKET